mgnify:CR=1 FL=1
MTGAFFLESVDIGQVHEVMDWFPSVGAVIPENMIFPRVFGAASVQDPINGEGTFRTLGAHPGYSDVRDIDQAIEERTVRVLKDIAAVAHSLQDRVVAHEAGCKLVVSKIVEYHDPSAVGKRIGNDLVRACEAGVASGRLHFGDEFDVRIDFALDSRLDFRPWFV